MLVANRLHLSLPSASNTYYLREKSNLFSSVIIPFTGFLGLAVLLFHLLCPKNGGVRELLDVEDLIILGDVDPAYSPRYERETAPYYAHRQPQMRFDCTSFLWWYCSSPPPRTWPTKGASRSCRKEFFLGFRNFEMQVTHSSWAQAHGLDRSSS